jgi:hypothetical protein
MSIVRQQSSIGLGRFIAAVLLPLIIGLSLFYLTMNPPMSDFSAMMELMLLTTLLSLAVAFAAYRLGWFNRLRRLQWSFMGVYVLAGVLVFANVWIIARLMFASSHDLSLATILLVFATGIATAVSYLLSAAFTERIFALNRAACNSMSLPTRSAISSRTRSSAFPKRRGGRTCSWQARCNRGLIR